MRLGGTGARVRFSGKRFFSAVVKQYPKSACFYQTDTLSSLAVVNRQVQIVLLTPAGGLLGRLDWLMTRFDGPEGICRLRW